MEEGKHVSNVVDYIHNNPVRAGIAKRVRDYRWSAAARGDTLRTGNSVVYRALEIVMKTSHLPVMFFQNFSCFPLVRGR